MKIVADENVDRRVIDWLRNQGHEITSIARDNPSAIDPDVLARAYAERALLITEDKDFGELVFHKRHSNFGVLLIRLEGLSRTERIRMVCDLMLRRGTELANAFSVLTPGSVRIRAKD